MLGKNQCEHGQLARSCEICHSPGVWRIEGDKVKTAISAGCKHVAMVNYFDCGTDDPRSISKEEHEANAKLIAAAPEMLDALQIALGIINRYAKNNKQIDGYSKIKDAIKLAVEGEQYK